MMKPRNLLFDLGGVIMDIRRQNCIEAFERLGMADISNFLGDYAQKGVFMELESGLITPADFRAEIRRHIPHAVTDEQIDRAFTAFLVGIPRRRLEALLDLKRRGYALYLLSNTNPIMWDGFIAEEFRQIDGFDINSYFAGMVTSFEAKVMKPEPEIFRIVERQCVIRPEATLFFDDSVENCRAASELGFMTVHVAPGQEFYDLLNE